MLDRIKKRISTDPIIRHRTIKVNCSNGNIILTGNVSSFYEKQMVQEAVKLAINEYPSLILTVKNEINVQSKCT